MVAASIFFAYFLVLKAKGMPLEERTDRFFEVKPIRKAHDVAMARIRAEESYRHSNEGKPRVGEWGLSS